MTTRRHAADETTESTAQIRADIAETRSELGDTVEELAAKTDVKQRARDTVETTKARAREKVSTGAHVVQDRAMQLAAKARPERVRHVARRVSARVRQRPVPYAVGAGAVVLTVLAIRRRRNR